MGYSNTSRITEFEDFLNSPMTINKVTPTNTPTIPQHILDDEAETLAAYENGSFQTPSDESSVVGNEYLDDGEGSSDEDDEEDFVCSSDAVNLPAVAPAPAKEAHEAAAVDESIIPLDAVLAHEAPIRPQRAVAATGSGVYPLRTPVDTPAVTTGISAATAPSVNAPVVTPADTPVAPPVNAPTVTPVNTPVVTPAVTTDTSAAIPVTSESVDNTIAANVSANPSEENTGVKSGLEGLRGSEWLIAKDKVDMKEKADMHWMITNLIPDTGIGQLYAPSMTGKTFLALSIAGAVSSGTKWFGREVEKRCVLYVNLEDPAGFIIRVEALKLANPDKEFELAYTSRNFSFSFRKPEDVNKLIKVAPKGSLIIIDTQNASCPDIDENSSKDMNVIISGAKKISDAINGVVMLVSHTGKDPDKGPRGSSAQIAAWDFCIELKGNPTSPDRMWIPKKVRSCEVSKDEKYLFHLKKIKLCVDKHGHDFTSCVVAEGKSTGNPAPVKRETVASSAKRENVSSPVESVAHETPHKAAIDVSNSSTSEGFEKDVAMLVEEVKRRAQAGEPPLPASKAGQVAFSWGIPRSARAISKAIEQKLLVEGNRKMGKGRILIAVTTF